jgi:hypothetical protein
MTRILLIGVLVFSLALLGCSKKPLLYTSDTVMEITHMS